MNKALPKFTASLVDQKFVPTALKLAVEVSSILFVINHGNALMTG